MWKRRCVISLLLCIVLMFSACNSTDPFESSSSQDSLNISTGSNSSGGSLRSSSESDLSADGKSSRSQSSSAGGGSLQESKPQGNAGGTSSSVKQPSTSSASGGSKGFSWDKGGNYTGRISVPTCSAPGALVKTGSHASAIDYSNAAHGYVMVKKGQVPKREFVFRDRTEEHISVIFCLRPVHIILFHCRWEAERIR